MKDLFGNEMVSAAFADIRNQQSRAAEEKAVLCLKLSKLVNKVPESVKSGSVQATRNWMEHQSKGRKVLAKKTSSRQDLQSAISQLEQYK